MIQVPEIRTSRLLLRRFKESDYDDLFEFLSQLENDEFEGYPGISHENGRKYLTERLRPLTARLLSRKEPVLMKPLFEEPGGTYRREGDCLVPDQSLPPDGARDRSGILHRSDTSETESSKKLRTLKFATFFP